jgi:dolichyl-phosphate beta-glucosyltransferase
MSQNDQPVADWIAKQRPIESELDISIVIPAYNEQWRIPTTIIDIIDYFDERKSKYEIIVVDDGSKDKTIEVVQKFIKFRPQVQLLRLPRNYGKGHAVRTGMLNARGKYILFTDADGSTPIKEIVKLEKHLDAGYDLAFGSRALIDEEINTRIKTRWYRKVLGRSFNFLVNLLILPGIADTQCGFKLFTNKTAQFIFKLQECDGFGFDLELLYIAKKANLKFKEVAVNWTHVRGSKVNLVVDASKMFLDIFIFRWRHRNIKDGAPTSSRPLSER